MAHLEKRKITGGAHTWRVVYRVNGIRYVESLGRVPKRIAEQRRAEVVSALALGKNPRRKPEARNNITLNDLLLIDEQWCKHRRQPKTLEINRHAVEKLIAWTGDKNIAQIDHRLMEAFINHLIESGFGNTSINMWIRSIKAVFNRALKEYHVIDIHKFKDIKPLSSSLSRDVIQFLTREQVGILLDNVKNIHFKRLVRFYLQTGCRRTEALELTWQDIDYNSNVINLGDARSKTKRRRTFPITKDLSLLIAELTLDRHENFERVFWRFSKNDPGKISGRIKRMRKIDGLPDNLKTHMLRHTFGSHLAMSGVDMLTISSLMGHTTMKVTELYAHLLPEHKKVSAERIPYRTK